MKEFVFNGLKPKEENHRSFLITAFSKSKKKPVGNIIIPIRKTSWDEEFNDKFGEFMDEVLSEYSGYKGRTSPVFADMSFKLTDFDYDEDGDLENFEDFNDFDDSYEKPLFFKRTYQLKENDINFINKKDKEMCVLKISENDLIIQFTQLADPVSFSKEKEQYSISYNTALDKFKNAMLKKYNITESEYNFLFSNTVESKNDFICQRYKIQNFEKILYMYVEARD